MKNKSLFIILQSSMNTPLPTLRATHFAMLLQKDLDHCQTLDFENEGVISTDHLFGKGNGQMFGILVCTDKQEKEVVLKAFSGQYDGRWEIPGWVGSVCESQLFASIMEENNQQIHALTDQLQQKPKARELLLQRKELSLATLKRLNQLYRFRCIDQSIVTFADIFGEKLPPTGTGECCAPKLLHYAFSHDLHPVSMVEFYYGAPNRSKSRVHKAFYGPCDDKCKPLLKYMLGLDIVYCDEQMLVVNKSSGLLSVPGRKEEMKDCVEARVKRLFPHAPVQCAVHRLDMDTSGLLVLALQQDSHRNLSMQFMHKEVKKEYVALLEGVIKEQEGVIRLPFRLDVENRPHQIYDNQQGKWGITVWEKLRVETYEGVRLATRIRFKPQTGRTHQLRLHSAHEKGLGHPIIGDRLYGKEDPSTPLHLHAYKLVFTHPLTQERLCFTSEVPF